MIVIVSMLSLATYAFVDRGVIASAVAGRDLERRSDVAAIAVELEQYYRANPTINGSSYPTTATMNLSVDTIIPDDELRTPPNQNSPNLVIASNASQQSPTTDEYVYQPLTLSGDLCSNSSSPCVRFVLYYRTEADNELVIVESSHQQ